MSKEPGSSPETAVAIPEVRAHLRDVVESRAFKGSRRGQQFLQHIVEKTLAGCGDELKERNLGVVLFGREPAYDTGEDAIVRVTASDVRKRLHQFYAESGSLIRIEIPAGAYTPHFRHHAGHDPAPSAPLHVRPSWSRRLLLSGLLLLAVAVPAAWRWDRGKAVEIFLPTQVLPWSILLQGDRRLQVVFSDPDISVMQELTGSPVTLSDYANRKFPTHPDTFGTGDGRALRLLRGANMAAVDVGIALAISRLASTGPAQWKSTPARRMQLSDFNSEEDFIILGSPRSNPWAELFDGQLDFDFVRDPAINREFIRNKRPQSGELTRYVPTARGWDTGHSFAMVALLANPNHAGKVLLVAGTNAEGTEAAGQFLVNTAELARTLQAHGIDPTGPPCHFQILFQVRTMAGSSSSLEVVACHRLAGPVPR